MPSGHKIQINLQMVLSCINALGTKVKWQHHQKMLLRRMLQLHVPF